MVSIEGQAEPAAVASEARADAAISEAVRNESGRFIREEVSNGAATAEERLTDQETLIARALARAHYHEEREAFLLSFYRASSFLVLLFGTTAFATLSVGTPGWIGQIVAGLTAALGALQIIFDFSGQSREHAILRKVATEIVASAKEDGADLVALEKRYVLASANSPPTFHAIEAEGYNHAQLAIGQSEATLLYIPFWHRVTKNIFRHSTTNYRYRSEIEAEKRATAH